MLTQKYRGEVKPLTNLSFRPLIATGGRLLLKASNHNGNCKQFNCYVEADELLRTAQRSLEILSSISGVKYRIVVQLGDKVVYL